MRRIHELYGWERERVEYLPLRLPARAPGVLRLVPSAFASVLLC